MSPQAAITTLTGRGGTGSREVRRRPGEGVGQVGRARLPPSVCPTARCPFPSPMDSSPSNRHTGATRVVVSTAVVTTEMIHRLQKRERDHKPKRAVFNMSAHLPGPMASMGTAEPVSFWAENTVRALVLMAPQPLLRMRPPSSSERSLPTTPQAACRGP